MAFVDECMGLLSDLLGCKSELKRYEIREKARRIMKGKKPIRRPVRMRRVLVTAAAIMLLIATTVTVYAVAPTFRRAVNALLSIETESDVEVRVWRRDGTPHIVYDGLDAMLEGEGLNLMMPHRMPEGVDVLLMSYWIDEDHIMIYPENCCFTMMVHFNRTDLQEYKDDADWSFRRNGITFYVYEGTTGTDVHVVDDEQGLVYSFIGNGENRELILDLTKSFY